MAATLEPHLRQVGLTELFFQFINRRHISISTFLVSSQFELTPIENGFMFVISGTAFALTSPIWGRMSKKGVCSAMFVLSSLKSLKLQTEKKISSVSFTE